MSPEIGKQEEDINAVFVYLLYSETLWWKGLKWRRIYDDRKKNILSSSQLWVMVGFVAVVGLEIY